MDPISLVAAFALGGEPKADKAPRPTATTAITSLPANPAASPPPVVVQFHEDAATKDDIRSLGDRVEAAVKPLDTRLAAVERKTEGLAADVAVLKAARQAPPVAKATATATTAERPKIYRRDAEGVLCWGWDDAELQSRIAQRDAAFAARTTRIVQPTYVAAPQYYTPPPVMSFGGFGGGYSMPMTLGGGFMGGGCAGGSCR